MILQALNDYYVRKAADPQGGLAPEGFEQKAIPFVLVIDEQGRLVQLADRREGVGKKKETKVVLVPQGVKRASGIAANLLWDTVEYVLGVDTRDKPDRVVEQHSAFVARLKEAFSDTPDDAGLRAVFAFQNQYRVGALESLAAHPAWPEILETNPLMTFQLNTDTELVCQRPAVIATLMSKGSNAPNGRCLVSGEADVIERLHPAIKGVWGAQTSGANIVSFNLGAFNSYGKSQSFNAPIGQRMVFTYTTALNHLLAKGSRQRVQVGDSSTVFWAEKISGEPFEAVFLDFLGPPKDDPDQGTQAVTSLYRSVKEGKPFTADDNQRFHVLGLAPNAARIAVRFWHVSTVTELGLAFQRYFEEVEIVRPAYEVGAPLSLFRLLAATALLGKADNIPPKLGGDVMRAILKNSRYPETLMPGALRRIRAEREVTYPRAALLKAKKPALALTPPFATATTAHFHQRR